jgi:hypothetical protein
LTYNLKMHQHFKLILTKKDKILKNSGFLNF